jgi:alanyl-tRNA synthetase
MRWTTDKIRQSFIDFFRERGHEILPSAPLVPKGDPTLLFTNAGMVPFKDYFLGIRTPPFKRVADCQKCLRISGKHNDLEAVGRDTYHHTFFEMLGNWSFGDYYKREAIQFHWELITKVWEIDPKLLWATVHQDDRESEDIWKDLGYLPPGRILRFGDKDNFWEMGETGPCGPNSEISVDRGAAACDGATHRGTACAVNVDGCSRFIELANLVFIQYNRDSSGKLEPLPMKHVDTGTGLDRVAAALQSIETGRILGNYDTDVFQKIIIGDERFTSLQRIAQDRPSIQDIVCSVGNRNPYGTDQESDISYRAIADHARAISFLIAEDLRPGNTEREYVLRRLIRRAARHARRLQVGMIDRLLVAACQGVIDAMGGAYEELRRQQDTIKQVVREEENRFHATLLVGEGYLQQEIHRLRNLEYRKSHTPSDPFYEEGEVLGSRLVLPGDVAFKLYDTFGFPLDLTQDILREHGIDVDVAEFERLMGAQRERSRKTQVISGAGGIPSSEAFGTPTIIALPPGSSRFVGHGAYEGESEIIAAIIEDPVPGEPRRVRLVVSETPFYPEGGGQIGDRGVIEADGAILEVVDTKKPGDLIFHIGRVIRGDVRVFGERGRRATLKVDRVRRDAAMLNHSATHILHYALRDVLGAHVHQAGSLVEPDRLRFDFSHQGPIGDGDLVTIEEEVNARIRENAEVGTEEMPYDDALKAGALAFFGDKYGDRVRVVRMGDFSIELCGGTHVARTGDIGFLRLASESGIAAGVRRVEAMTGQGALEVIREREKLLENIGAHLGAKDAQALERLEKLLAREKELEKKIRGLEQKLASGAGGGSAEQVRDAGGIKVVTLKLESVEARTLREIADHLREKYTSAVIAIGSDLGDKAAVLVAVTPDLVGRFKAGDLIREIAPMIGGSGGGRPELAQAGGKDPSKLAEALEKAYELVKSHS